MILGEVGQAPDFATGTRAACVCSRLLFPLMNSKLFCQNGGTQSPQGYRTGQKQPPSQRLPTPREKTSRDAPASRHGRRATKQQCMPRERGAVENTIRKQWTAVMRAAEPYSACKSGLPDLRTKQDRSRAGSRSVHNSRVSIA